MRIDYQLLLTDISKKQGLGIPAHELPLIINTDLATYTMAYLFYEDEDYLVITVPNKDGAEFAKILPKSTILSVELIYTQMLEKPTTHSKEDGMYG